MAARRTMEEEQLIQCKQFFARENLYWDRMIIKKITCTAKELTTKNGDNRSSVRHWSEGSHQINTTLRPRVETSQHPNSINSKEVGSNFRKPRVGAPKRPVGHPCTRSLAGATSEASSIQEAPENITSGDTSGQPCLCNRQEAFHYCYGVMPDFVGPHAGAWTNENVSIWLLFTLTGPLRYMMTYARPNA